MYAIRSYYGTSVERVSRTQPLPAANIPNIVAHALAGEMIGMRYVYLEAGSGAKNPVSPEIIRAVRSEISVPLIVGGGIRTPEYAAKLVDAGADFRITSYNVCYTKLLRKKSARPK